MKTWKTYDTWMHCGSGAMKMTLEAANLLQLLAAAFGEKISIEAFEFIGCAARVQIRCAEDYIDTVREKTNIEWEESRGFVRQQTR